MNVLFVINKLELGGAETFLLRLVNSLKKEFGVTPFLYCVEPTSSNLNFEQYFLDETGILKISTYQNPTGIFDWMGWKVNALFSNFFKVARYENYLVDRKKNYFKSIILKSKIDIINSHLLGADFFVLENIFPHVKIPWVATSQGCYNDLDDVDFANKLMSALNGLTFVAEKNLGFFRKNEIQIIENSRLIYNGIPKPTKESTITRSELGFAEDDIVLIQVSRSIPSKGMEESILATILAVKSLNTSKLKLLMVGPENEYFNELKSRYNDLEFVNFYGEHLNPLELVQCADIGILPSFFPGESCPSTIIEYLASGKPVVSTVLGEIPNMIKFNDETAGILIDLDEETKAPKIESLTEAILLLVNDTDFYLRKSQIAVKAFEKFEIAKSSNLYFDIYQNAILNYERKN